MFWSGQSLEDLYNGLSRAKTITMAALFVAAMREWKRSVEGNIRALGGIDRAAAKAAFGAFPDDKRYTKNQIQFVTLIIDELTDRGVVEAGRVYESPYDAVAPEGPEAIFVEADLDRIFGTVARLAQSANP